MLSHLHRAAELKFPLYINRAKNRTMIAIGRMQVAEREVKLYIRPELLMTMTMTTMTIFLFTRFRYKEEKRKKKETTEKRN